MNCSKVHLQVNQESIFHTHLNKVDCSRKQTRSMLKPLSRCYQSAYLQSWTCWAWHLDKASWPWSCWVEVFPAIRKMYLMEANTKSKLDQPKFKSRRSLVPCRRGRRSPLIRWSELKDTSPAVCRSVPAGKHSFLDFLCLLHCKATLIPVISFEYSSKWCIK